MPLAALVVWIGIQPGFFLNRMAPTLDRLTWVAQEALVAEYTERVRAPETRVPEASQVVPQEVRRLPAHRPTAGRAGRNRAVPRSAPSATRKCGAWAETHAL